MSKLRIRKKSKLKKKVIGINLDGETMDQLNEIKAKTGVGVADIIRQMVIFSLKRVDIGEDNSQA